MRHFLLLAASLALLTGCDTESPVSSNPITDTSKTVVAAINISGRVDLSSAGGISATRVTVACAGIQVHPDAKGDYVITGSLPPVSGRVAGRIAGDHVAQAYIIIGTDTLREIPVVSWSSVLPTSYIVQRNVAVSVPRAYAGLPVQAVWWSDDSIARVINLGSGTSTTKYSGFIYTAYDDSQYSVNAHLYNLFARVTSLGDSVLAYTNIAGVRAMAGDLSYDSSQFTAAQSFKVLGYTLAKNDSSLAMYKDVIKRKAVATSYDSLVLDSTLGSWRDSRTGTKIDAANVNNALSGDLSNINFTGTVSKKLIDTVYNTPDSSLVTTLSGVAVSFVGTTGSADISFGGLDSTSDMVWSTVTTPVTGDLQTVVLPAKAWAQGFSFYSKASISNLRVVFVYKTTHTFYE